MAKRADSTEVASLRAFALLFFSAQLLDVAKLASSVGLGGIA